MKRSLSLGLVALFGAVAGTLVLSRPDGRAAEAPAKPDAAAVERARKQVRMLDHIYKTTVVLITDKHVVGVTTNPTMIAFTRTLGPHSIARLSVALRRPAFAAP